MSDLNAQMSIAERLQTKWLEHMERLIDNGEATSTDMATLARFLMANGWSLDPSRLPKGLQGMITSSLDPDDFEDEEEKVIARIAKRA